MNTKRGFSLVEVVVAILIVVIASSITFTVVFSSRNVLNKTQLNVDATNEAQNIVKLYVNSDGNEEKFSEYIKFAHDCNEPIDFYSLSDGTYTIYYDNNFGLSDLENHTFRIIFKPSTNKLEVYNSSNEVI